MISNSRTSAPRSAIVHAVGHPENGASFTRCGRRIGDTWAGEYTEQPAEDVNCARCIKGATEDQAATEAAATIKVGQRVGIFTGFQSVGGKWIGSYGTVTAVREYWRNSVTYLVRADGESESFAYDPWQITDDTSRDVAPITAAAIAAGIPVGADGWPIVGHPVWQMNANGTGDLLVTIGEWVKRARSMAAHPAGKRLARKMAARARAFSRADADFTAVNRSGIDPLTGLAVVSCWSTKRNGEPILPPVPTAR